MESSPPNDDRRASNSISGPSRWILATTACLLILGAISYGGAVALRGVWKREDPAEVRARTVEKLKQIGQELLQNGDSAGLGSADASPPVESSPEEGEHDSEEVAPLTR